MLYPNRVQEFPSFFSVLRLVFTSTIQSRRNGIRWVILLMSVVAGKKIDVLLADDDEDDRVFFEEAIAEVAPNVNVTGVPDGERLLNHLLNANQLPHMIFLDLNMPIKNGWDCLKEIRSHDKLKHLPIIIYSTSASRENVDETYHIGASLYIRKPDSFSDLKGIARKVFAFDWDNHMRPSREKYLLTA
jgi:CheY-like chemotaxis protein